MKKLLRGGFVVTPRGSRRADGLLDGEKIAQVGHISPAEAKSAEVTDVSGCYLFPGFIDAHTHFDLDVCNTTTADDFASGTRSAIRGGTTTIIDFACPNKGETLAYGLDLWHKKADGKCSCDYGFHMTIDDWNEGIEGELDDMFAAGITSFKMYLPSPAMMIGDGAVYSALKALKKRGGIAGVHCENAGVIDARIAELKAAGRAADVSAHPEARPDYLEAEAVARLLRIAEAADAPVVIVHLTNREALDEVAFARARGQRVYVETCPQYLTLTDEVYEKPDFEGAKFVCSPPIRSEADKAALWGGIKAGEVDIISTDHCSFNFKRQKELGRGNFSKIPNGLPGIEHRPMLLWTEGVNTGKLSAEEFCRLLSTEPAKAFGMYPRKGELKPGADADIVVWDPEATMRLTATDMNMLADYSPWEGAQLRGLPKAVFLHGELAAEKGRVKKPCGGRYVRREKSLGF